MATNTISTKEQILYLIKKIGALSANDIAEKLQITDIAIRRHLDNLERDGLVRTELVRQSMGRPSNLYSLTELAEVRYPRNYADLTLDFLNDICELQGEEMVATLFERREERLKEKYQNEMHGVTLDTLIEELTAIQEKRGYMTDLEKDETTGHYVLTEHNCPIHDVAQSYNQACSSELSLFKNVLNADVEQFECKTKGGQRCVYIIKQNSSE